MYNGLEILCALLNGKELSIEEEDSLLHYVGTLQDIVDAQASTIEALRASLQRLEGE